MARILVISDGHSGHRSGLCPPKWQDSEAFKYGRLQRLLWNHYSAWVDELRPYDLVLTNGDMLDGRGEKSGGTELITTDRLEQAEMGAECIRVTGCSLVRMTHGTAYHTASSGEDFETTIIDKLPDVDAKITSHLFLNVNGVEINMRHHMGSSSIPHGTLTPLAKEVLINHEYFIQGVQPLAKILIRSHTHHYDQAEHDGTLAFCTPSLQGLGSKFGSRRVSKVVHFGLIVIDITEDGHITWQTRMLSGKEQANVSEHLSL